MAKATASSEAVIGRSAKVRGRITGEGDLTVLGQVEGEVNLKGDLIIGEGGSIQSTQSGVDANTVTVSGTLLGDVHARGVIRIESGANVIEEGAAYTGRLDAQFDLPPELSGEPSRDGRAGAKRR
jgi:cytoskeletal protein CcmA (bactofilin family)